MPERDAPKAQIKLNSRLVPALVVILAIARIVDPYRGWTYLLIGFGGAWLIAYLWVNQLSTALNYRREMRFGWAQVGDRLEERFTLTNTSSVPATWVEVIDNSTMPDYLPSQVRSVGPKTQIRWHTQGMCTRRGLFNLGPTTLKTGDPFGIYTLTLDDTATATFMVMPPIVPLPSIRVAPGGRAGEGVPRVDAPEQTVSSVSVREYQPGDSFRWVHWPTTARQNQFFVRVFEGAPAGDWWIFLDMDHEVQIGEGQNSTMEHGIILAASLSDRGLRAGRAVGLLSHTQAPDGGSTSGKPEEMIWLPPKMSDSHRWEILRSLALVEAGGRPLAELLNLAGPTLGQNTSLILITPNLSLDWVEALLDLRRRGVVPTALLFDHSSFGGELETDSASATLSAFGIRNEIIHRQLLDRQEARPGREGHWDWQVTPLGRAFHKHRAGDLTWRDLLG
jgi:uncharacterized protein (DUF58 family)